MYSSINLSSVVFREAARDDISALVELVNVAYRRPSDYQGWLTEADLVDGQRTDADDLSGMLARPDNLLLLAECEGYLLVSCRLEKLTAVGCRIGMFAVHPRCQRVGLGRMMLARAEREVRERWHCSTMYMDVVAQRGELIAWYERCGYDRTGRQKPFQCTDPRFGIPRRTDLYFVELRKELSQC